MTQKRRVVYLSDEQWEAAIRGSVANKESISAYVGRLLLDALSPRAVVTHPGATEAELDSYRHFRPVPKPGKGK